MRRRVARLRALVLLPSRDLAMQVHAVFDRYARGTGLRVGLAIGQTNFLEEQLALVGPVALTGIFLECVFPVPAHVQFAYPYEVLEENVVLEGSVAR